MKQEAKRLNAGMLQFIEKCPTAFHTAAESAYRLQAAGFTELSETEAWQLKPGKYFVRRNGSAICAFILPKAEGVLPYRLIAGHGDSPALRVKSLKPIKSAGGIRVLTEPYGGGLWGTWFDRPLSVAGRVMVAQKQGASLRLVNLDEDLLMLPNLPIHFNREANNGVKIDPATDLLPLLAVDADSLEARLSAALQIEATQILSSELLVYCRSRGFVWGQEAYLSAPRLDDLQCVYATLCGFLEAEEKEDQINLWVCLDNEEVGSMTKQGAAGTFLSDLLARIGEGRGLSADEQKAALASGFMISADNAHAVHPNRPEVYDSENIVQLNGGPVIKHAVAYATDGKSDGVIRFLAGQAGIPMQDFANRSDLRGGSTLANIATGNLSIPMVDIGLPQLAMHSAFETTGAMDTLYGKELAKAFYGSTFQLNENGLLWM